MAHTFRREERMKKGDFRRVRWRKNSETNHFIHQESATEVPERKFAAITPKRIGNAVQRNRMRRLLRQFYRLNKNLFQKEHTHLIRVKKIPGKAVWGDVSRELDRLLAGSQI